MQTILFKYEKKINYLAIKHRSNQTNDYIQVGEIYLYTDHKPPLKINN